LSTAQVESGSPGVETAEVARENVTNRFGGAPIPQAQQHLIPIDFLDPDNRICPGTLAQVKVQIESRSETVVVGGSKLRVG
jgi:hypothetical protein